jgi:hypothetical protein
MNLPFRGHHDPFGHRVGAKIFLRERHLHNTEMRPVRPEGVHVHIIRDRFSLCPFPFIVYNAKFGVPYSANYPAGIDRSKAPIEAYTPFQLHTRGITLSDELEEAFGRGDQICIMPAYDDDAEAGTPGHGTIGVMATKAFYAQCIRAQRVLQAVHYREERDRKPHDVFRKQDLDRIGKAQLGEIERAVNSVTSKYKDPEVHEIERSISARHIESKGSGFVRAWFKCSQAGAGRPQVDLLRQALLEAYCFEQIHGWFDADRICEVEIQIVKVLRTAQLRAIACYRLQRTIAVSQLKKSQVIKSGTASRLHDGFENDLNIWGCFLAALHGGFNPAMIYRSLAEYADLFDIAAWLGYFGRGDVDMLTPEISEPLLAILKLDVSAQTVEHDDERQLHQVYLEIQRVAELLIGKDKLADVVSRVVAQCEPVEVPRRYYHAVTTPSDAKTDHPRLELDPRFGVADSNNDEMVLSVDWERYPIARLQEQFRKGERLSVQRFSPLIW